MISRLRVPVWAIIMVIYLSIFMSSPAIAGLIASTPSPSRTVSPIRDEDISKIQRVLESKIVAEKLSAYGLTPGEVKEKLQSMSDDQVHLLAQASGRLLVGGDGGGVAILFILLFFIFFLLVILEVMGRGFHEGGHGGGHEGHHGGGYR